MRRVVEISVILLVVSIALSCQRTKEPDLARLIKDGEFSGAEMLLSKKIGETRNDSILNQQYIIQLETLHRIRKEFPYSRTDVIEQLKPYYPDITTEQLDKWETARQLEMRFIDGEKRYFSRAVSNLFRLNDEAGKLKKSVDGETFDAVKDFKQKAISKYFEEGLVGSGPFNQHQMKLTYTVKLKAGVVPAGEIVRCWLPYPRTGSARLSKVDLLSASESNYVIAPPETLQRSIYMEKPALKNEETEFAVSYVVHLAAQWFNLDSSNVLPYETESELYKKYTSEQRPHIVFSDSIRHLAKEIVGEEQDPVNQVRKLYYWINNNIPWAGALEYSVMDCIPEYVLENRHGDCGMQTFLFLSMARSLGIPCKWQSGWYLLPEEKNLHDWAEVYYEGIGWVPVDPSFKLIDSDDIRVKEFYMNGLDNYRLVINDAVGTEFHPKKKYYRSEPYDFQRGELEWKGGNLYFDTWTYHLEVEELD